uniref:NACHT domain-containing protein n=1 Tax=Astyanax mexicanus TaxID=7994 RepID=A0A3B1JZK9_ASTMX
MYPSRRSYHQYCCPNILQPLYNPYNLLLLIHVFLSEGLTPACQQSLKSYLKEKFQKIYERISHHTTSTLLNEIYTELYVTEDGSEEFNNEHEVRQIETASRRPSPETSIKCSDLFENDVFRTVLTKGVAGIGKTIFVQKFILDWAEGKSNHGVNFIFPLPFRELNLMRNEFLSLENLLHKFFPDTKQLRPLDYVHNKVLFIFDGLDESQLPLDFHNNERLTTVTQVASVDALITNLIKGNLLRSALLWITSRPAAVSQIPLDCIDHVTEVQGFNDHQKEEYFRKKIIDQSLANRIIKHIKSSRSLYSMCHIPVFCWIAATVLEEMLGDAEIKEIPKTLTQMFTRFLIFQIKQSGQKYQGKTETDPDKINEVVWKLGKLAFHKLEEGNLVFYEEDLKQCGIDREMSIFSGLFTQIFTQDFGLHIGKVFSFVHLTVQEFLAALYAFFSFILNNKNVLEKTGLRHCFGKSTVSDFLKHAVNKALESKNGHLDLFLRFLLGLSVESNQTFFRGLLPQSASSSDSKEATVNYIKRKIRENASPEKSINLFHCLNELNDLSLVHEIQRFLSTSGSYCLRDSKLSPAQWSALVFVLLNSEEKLDEIELCKYDPSEECLQRLFPVVKASRKAL